MESILNQTDRERAEEYLRENDCVERVETVDNEFIVVFDEDSEDYKRNAAVSFATVILGDTSIATHHCSDPDAEDSEDEYFHYFTLNNEGEVYSRIVHEYTEGYPEHNSNDRTRDENRQIGDGKDGDTSSKEENMIDTEISVEESLDILDLSDDVDSEKEVINAYRARVKDSHPDVGGEAEDFDKTKKARDEVLEYIDT